jgi:ferritin-like metal-binding protein YciE
MTHQPHLQKLKEKERERISRLLMYLNDALAMENASAERLQTRTKETDIKELKIVLQKHLQETRQQQKRIEEIITNMGGKPTEEKAGLPILTSAKSIAEDMENKATTAEWQLRYAEQE